MKHSKKILSLLLTLALALGLLPAALAAEQATVYVTVEEEGRFVTNADGQVIAAVPVTVDAGATIHDAFAALHEQYYGGSDGYATETTQWGDSVAVFWGIPSSSVGYYHNNASAMGLTETVEDGDCLTFFFYQDTTAWSDTYTYFDAGFANLAVGAPLELTLTAAGWESSSPLAGASVTVDGETAGTTDENGKVTLTFDRAGTYLVSAAADGFIVAPVCVVTVSGEADDKAAVETLLNNIAASYADNSGEWVVMDMAAYAKLGLTGTKTSDAAKQQYINSAIASIQAEGAGDTTYAKAVLGLTAVGVDATRLYPLGSETALSALDGLNGVAQSTSAWCAPYTLAAYNQGRGGSAAQEQALVDAILAAQADDGSWSEWGDSVQTTANMIVGLSFYRETNADAAAALSKAVDYLSAAQKDDGSYDAYGYGADANTAAMVVLGLSAAGVDPAADPRFVKNGVSALDGLLAFAYADGSGFGYQSNEKGEDASSVAYATEQAFRALIAAYQVMTTGEAYNLYDFSGNAVAPGSETSSRNPDVKQVPVTAPGATFPDIAGHEVQTAVEALAERGIITGKDSGLYDPDADMTRAEFAAIVVRALGLEPKAAGNFPDVKDGDWFAPYVGAASAYGIVNGKDGGVFDPLGTITRQEAAAMVARAAKLCGLDTELDDAAVTNVLAQFGDYTAVGDWARQSVAFCYGADILDQSDLDVRPAAAILRGEIAQMLYNLLNSAKLL